jgi:GT2 family glycosyltransferase
MAVSFVIPNWNRRDLLLATLASLGAQTEPPLEILVVDNASSDGSAEAARRAGARVLPLDHNTGFSFAVNRGLEAARGELVAVVNNDVEFAPDWTGRLRQALEGSGAWFAFGKLLDHASRDHIDGVGDALCRGGAALRLGHGRPDGPVFQQPRRSFFPSGTAFVARREFFARAGPLEEAFFAYLEDVDLGLRAALLDLAGLYVPEAVAYHRGSATLGAGSPEMIEWITRNQILLLAKFYPTDLLRRLWRPVLAAQALWFLLALRQGRVAAWARGLRAGLAGREALRRSGAAWRADGTRLATILSSSERELLYFERSTGWDAYWRWYFRLAPAPQETQS